MTKLIALIGIKYLLMTLVCFFSFPVQAAQLRVAVAANFKPVLQILAQHFEQDTHHKVSLSSASSGVLYNQITHGAPFDLFLSADSSRPRQLEKQGLTVKGSRKTYAYGELVLWSRGEDKVSLNDLRTYKGRLAMANPVTAPYGLAARQVLKKMSLWNHYRKRVVKGASIQQTWQFVASGNVPMGLVARSQLVSEPYKSANISAIDSTLYDPIQQELVILKRTVQGDLAQAFSDYILSEKSQSLIASQGYQPAISGA